MKARLIQGSTTTNVTVEFRGPLVEFLPVYCCGARVGFANPLRLTPEAIARYRAIRQQSILDGNGDNWIDDPEVQALDNDPKARAPRDDGERIPFPCKLCGASFVWAAGRPLRVPKEAV